MAKRLPADKDVEGWFAVEDLLELPLKIESGSESIVGTVHAFGLIKLLAIDPVAKVGVGEQLQSFSALALGSSELVIVNQGTEAMGIAIPDLPDEGS